ncbi:SapC family protein [Bisbaumannia pacifica]|uniref:SapC family protein n=1 Tax=Bisbaumannia pacifica TaxID=77098 RepID=A0A510XCS8_9GAMM|nr:SapC family protein [Halomonas pacifica]MBH8581157.1 SapC family protein [Halomonas pacifica]GEK48325.1 hypothetical protein HPA02_26080 [Halomonas pacifica]
MSRYVPLSKTQHAQSGVVAAGHEFALEQAVVPVLAEELPHVLPTMAVAFVQGEQDADFELVVLQSLQAGVNVYVHTNGRWIGGYRPAWYRAHPFRVLRDTKSRQPVVCVDEESQAFQAEAGEDARRLFDDDGELTAQAQQTVRFLEKLEQGRRATQALVGQLRDAGVIVPWNLSARNPEGESGFDVKGLFHIDEAALRALDASVLSELAKSGALSVAYSQLLSEHRLKGLSRLYELRKLAEAQAKSADDVELDELFGDDDDDFSFDFDS